MFPSLKSCVHAHPSLVSKLMAPRVGAVAQAPQRVHRLVKSVPSQSSCNNTHRWYRTTPAVHFSNKDAEEAKPTPEQLNETEDTIPEYQNPRHHNNPDMEKMFEGDAPESELQANPLPPFETDPDKVVAPPHIEALAHEIVNLTLLELKELTDKIAEHFDFDDEVMAASYGSTVMVAGGAGGAAAAEEVEEAKTIFDLKLVGFDAKAKIKVIKEVRSIAGLGLKEAKELVESAPKVVQKDVSQEKADELKAQLEAIGAQVEIV
eukprot:Nitzschia sp. Nitz4//scaffold148_size54725//40834//41622//NITZ4_006665-RA/size54725-processed-gene-0.16-mRNA-1//1//CDS//3329536769//5542//frame0